MKGIYPSLISIVFKCLYIIMCKIIKKKTIKQIYLNYFPYFCKRSLIIKNLMTINAK